MKNLIWKVSLKWALILTIIALIPQVINTFAYGNDGLITWIGVAFGFIYWIAIFVCIIWAHIEFQSKNESYISFGNAIIIGLIILIISSLISGIYGYINTEFILKERIAEHMAKLSHDSGMDMNEIMPTGTQKTLLTLSTYVMQIAFLFTIITVEATWKIYQKADKPGWACIVPFYNIIVLLQIVKKPWWWIFLLFIPFITIIFGIWITNLISLRFGKNEGFTIGLLFLPFVFFPLIGFGKTEYIEVLPEKETE